MSKKRKNKPKRTRKKIKECSRGELETVIELLQEALTDENCIWREVFCKEGLKGLMPNREIK